MVFIEITHIRLLQHKTNTCTLLSSTEVWFESHTVYICYVYIFKFIMGPKSVGGFLVIGSNYVLLLMNSSL